MKSKLLVTAAALSVVVCIAACGSSSGVGGATSPAAQAADLPETGLQGEVPLADQNSGRSAQGYRKGLRLVGQNTIMNRGANFDLAWLDDCAYVSTTSPAQLEGTSTSPYLDSSFNPLNGMAVIDAADPANPKLLKILQSPAMLLPHESMHANQQRHIIVATEAGGTALDVYDASDCRNPVLKSTIQVGVGVTLPPLPVVGPIQQGISFRGHAMCMTDDGLTVYTTSSAQSNAIVDLTDLSKPKVLQIFTPGAHDCGLNPDGTRLYLAIFGFVSLGAGIPNGTPVGNNGLMILDVSGYQHRAANPTLPVVSQLGWTNVLDGEAPSAGSHTAQWFRNGGRSYIYSSDEWPVSYGCPWAHSRIIDITDETHPVKVSDIRLAVADAANCAAAQSDTANYSAHYVGIDDVNNATTLFTTNYAAGLRVVDIHDPAKPKEIAYYHPAPNPNTAPVFGSQGFGSSGALWDAVATYVRYRPQSGQIWIAGYTSGFQILELTASAGPTAPRLTGR